MKIMVLRVGQARREGCDGVTATTPAALRKRLRIWGFTVTRAVRDFTERQAYPVATSTRSLQADDIAAVQVYRYKIDWQAILYRFDFASARQNRRTWIVKREDLKHEVLDGDYGRNP